MLMGKTFTIKETQNMPPVVEPTMLALTSIVSGLYVGTNLAMLHFLWMLINGSLMPHRGAVFPALQSTGIGEQAVRRAWKAFHSGVWQISELMVAWNQYMEEQQRWQPRSYEGYGAVAVDTTPFWRPKLQGLKSKYYNSVAEKALPAVILGLVARIGEVANRRIALPCAILRVDPKDPSEAKLKKEILDQVSRTLKASDIMLVDAGFKIKSCLEAKVPRFLLRLAKNFTARRNYLRDTTGKKGNPPTKGDLVRPLARKHKEKEIAASEPDATFSWPIETGKTITVQVWYNLVRPDVEPSPTADLFDVYAISDPRYDTPLLVATNVKLLAQTAHALYTDRWPVEQLPLAGKQMVGAHRQFVFAAETRHRLPELVILAGSILTGLAALHPTMSTGFWDRKPEPTPGRFRRALAGLPFPQSYPLPTELRQKASVTNHLPKGILAHRRSKPTVFAVST